jgi:hypothetical protein
MGSEPARSRRVAERFTLDEFGRERNDFIHDVEIETREMFGD